MLGNRFPPGYTAADREGRFEEDDIRALLSVGDTGTRNRDSEDGVLPGFTQVRELRDLLS